MIAQTESKETKLVSVIWMNCVSLWLLPSFRKWRCCQWKYVWRYSVSWITAILLLLNKVSLTHSLFFIFTIFCLCKRFFFFFFFFQSNWRCNWSLSFKTAVSSMCWNILSELTFFNSSDSIFILIGLDNLLCFPRNWIRGWSDHEMNMISPKFGWFCLFSFPWIMSTTGSSFPLMSELRHFFNQKQKVEGNAMTIADHIKIKSGKEFRFV